MDNIVEYLPLLIPYLIVTFILIFIALRHLFTHDTPRIGNKMIWAIVIVIIQIIGPILYFVIGRQDS